MKNSYIQVLEEVLKETKNSIGKRISKNVKLEDKKISLFYFNGKVEIDLETGKFIPDLDVKEKILILHYVCKDSNVFSEELITFKNLPDGNFYFPSIYSRIYKPLIEKYGKNPEKFIEKMLEIGSIKVSEFAVKLSIFPDIFFIYEIIPEDEEFPPDLKVFFNKSAPNIFDIEDLAIIGEIIVSKIL